MAGRVEARILFVDDESRVLDGLKRSLRRFRPRWEMVFAEGGRAGLAELDKQAFDVVVSDTRMSSIGGHGLLENVRAKHPDTIRIILSGQTDQAAALRAVPVAHQFIAKPIETRQLEQVLARAVAMRTHLDRNDLRAVVSRIGSLPSPPRSYFALSRALEDTDTTAGDIAEIIEQDIGMSAKILQVVNSAFFGLPREMSSVKDAVAFLGTDTIRSLLLTVEAFRPFEGKGGITSHFIEREQQHGLLAGAIGRRIAKQDVDGDAVIVAAMLHDIGRVVLASEFPEKLNDVYLAGTTDGAPILERELDAFGANHEQVGAYLLGSWGLPFDISEAVAFHHEPRPVEHARSKVVQIVHVAATLASECADEGLCGGRPGDERLPVSAPRIMEPYGRIDEWRAIAREEARLLQEGRGDVDAA